MKGFEINKLLYILLFLVFFSIIKAQQPPIPKPGTGGSTSGGTTGTPGVPSKTPIDIYVVGLGAMGVLLAVGYGRKYYSINKL